MTLTATPASGHTFSGWSGACTGNGTCTLVFNGDVLVAETFYGTAAYVYYHQDAIGSVRAITNEAGVTIIRHDYQPFGEDNQLPPGDPIRFAGKELDPETVQSYFGARYYRNTLGRFTTVDPALHADQALIDPQLWNRYAYARNRPFSSVDKDGRWPTEIHSAIYSAALSHLSNAQADAIKRASKSVDNPADGGQSSAQACQHVMRAPWESVEEAAERGAAWFDEDLALASSTSGAESLTHFGRAVHFLTDAFSPAHGGEAWYGTDLIGAVPTPFLIARAVAHSLREAHISLSDFLDAVQAVREVYYTTYGAVRFKEATGCD